MEGEKKAKENKKPLPPLHFWFPAPSTEGWMCPLLIEMRRKSTEEGRTGTWRRAMFTHGAANFTWHQLCEHSLLHDLRLAERIEEGGRPLPCDSDLLCRSLLSASHHVGLFQGFLPVPSEVLGPWLFQSMQKLENTSNLWWRRHTWASQSKGALLFLSSGASFQIVSFSRLLVNWLGRWLAVYLSQDFQFYSVSVHHQHVFISLKAGAAAQRHPLHAVKANQRVHRKPNFLCRALWHANSYYWRTGLQFFFSLAASLFLIWELLWLAVTTLNLISDIPWATHPHSFSQAPGFSLWEPIFASFCG